MGVLSLKDDAVWEANSALIRLLLNGCERTYGQTDWIIKARNHFELGYKHWPLEDYDDEVAEMVLDCARDISKNAALNSTVCDEETLSQSFRELAELIERHLDAT